MRCQRRAKTVATPGPASADHGTVPRHCDKIVPGLLIGALQFSHLPALFVPGGPMPSGISNDERVRVRQRFAEATSDATRFLNRKRSRITVRAPVRSTGPPTATRLIEVMGLHHPGAAFVNASTPMRDALTAAAAFTITSLSGK